MIGRPARLVLLGRSLSHSLSPRLHNAALRHEAIPLTYEVLDIPAAALDATLEMLARDRGAGNVTIPYKESVASRCLRLSPIAARLGAVNTFWHEHGELSGDNTDVDGFDWAVQRLLGAPPRAMSVGVLGAGGGAAAVLAAVERWSDCHAYVYNRTAARATALCARFSAVAEQVDGSGAVADADLVVNATPIGLRDDDVPLEAGALRPNAAVFDLVYRPRSTAWVRAAVARGLRASDGLPMLVEQGALAFERWFGLPPDREVMWSAVR